MRLRLLRRLPVEFAQETLHLLVILLDLTQDLFNVGQRDLLVRFVGGSRFILAGAVVLDFLAGFLDFVQTQGCGGTFEEVAEGGEVGEFFIFPVFIRDLPAKKEGGRGGERTKLSPSFRMCFRPARRNQRRYPC